MEEGKGLDVNPAALAKPVEVARAEAAKASRTQPVEGTWNLDPEQPRFAAEVSFEGYTARIEADQPVGPSDGGCRPGPIQYALVGLGSCFTAPVAARRGFALDSVRTAAEFDLNFSKGLRRAALPVVAEVRGRRAIKGPASRPELESAVRVAELRCRLVPPDESEPTRRYVGLARWPD